MLLGVGLVSCSSCAKSPQVEPTPVPVPTPAPTATTPPPEPPAPSTVVSGENWSFDPGEGFKVLMPPKDEIKAVMLNPTQKVIVIFTKEEFAGTLEQYTLLAIRGFRDSGANLTSATQVELNGTKFVLLETSKVNSSGVKIVAWQWATVKDKQGYGFTCGGPATDSGASTLCPKISSTLKIN